MNVRAAGGSSAGHLPGRRAGYGAAPPAARLLRIADATALRAGLAPGDLCGPAGRKHGQAQACPGTRGALHAQPPEFIIGNPRAGGIAGSATPSRQTATAVLSHRRLGRQPRAND